MIRAPGGHYRLGLEGILSDNQAQQAYVTSVIGAARAAGFTGCEVLLQTTTTRTATWQTAAVQGAVHLGPRTISTLHFRGFMTDGRSCATSTRVSVDKLPDALIKDALGALGSDGDVSPAPRLDVPTMGLGVLDRRYGRIEDEDRGDVVSSNVNGCNAVDGAVCAMARYTEALEVRTFASSRGVEYQEAGTRY